MTLTEFLLARIAEDEVDATEIHQRDCDLVRQGSVDPAWGWECTCGHPARVLAECEAHRRIVAEHSTTSPYRAGSPLAEIIAPECDVCAVWEDVDYEGPPRVPWPCPTLRALAAVYADHPDYRDEWR